jgi:hypothetical protein
MEWTLHLDGAEIGGQSRSFDVMTIRRPDGLGEIATFGLTLAEAQQQVVAAQAHYHAVFRPDCHSGGSVHPLVVTCHSRRVFGGHADCIVERRGSLAHPADEALTMSKGLRQPTFF